MSNTEQTDVPVMPIGVLMGRVMADITAIGKARRNQEQNYAFRGIEDFMNALHPVLAKHGVYIVPSVIHAERDLRERTNAQGKPAGYLVHAFTVMGYRFYGPAGDYVEGSAIGEGKDFADKATNKTMSAAFKYMLMQTFCVPTEDIDDSDRTSPVDEPQDAPAPAKRATKKAAAAPREAARPEPEAPTEAPPAPTMEQRVEKLRQVGWAEHATPEMVAKVDDLKSWMDSVVGTPVEAAIKGAIKRSGARSWFAPDAYRAIKALREADGAASGATPAPADEKAISDLIVLHGNVVGPLLSEERWIEIERTNKLPADWADYTADHVAKATKILTAIRDEEPF